MILATLASVIASQAVISGAYSLTKQAIQLGLLPRMRVMHTSADEVGQIYVPLVNWIVMAAVLLAMLGFGSSSALASAYGIAVTVTMFITTLLTFFVVRYGLGLSAASGAGRDGSVPRRGRGAGRVVCDQAGARWLVPARARRHHLRRHGDMAARPRTARRACREDDPELISFITALSADETIRRTPRTAVYAVANPETVPQALLHNLKHNQVLHEQNVILTVRFQEVPYVADAERLHVEPLVPGFWKVQVDYGFKDEPDIPRALRLCTGRGLVVDEGALSYFLSREIVVPTRGAGMMPWREALFATMSRNAGSVVEFFRLPDNGVVELGTRVQI